ncbi:MAG: thiamine phosphate synthase, partial [Gemmatimonadales bacterium]|nr:thiamine phosphate synthase [Gemmatimonadales bacterium]
ATRFVTLARPPMASVFVTGRVDVALACGADGVIARSGDLDAGAVRDAIERSTVPRRLVVVQSVHSLPQAEAAVAAGADGLLLGTIWETATHPGRTPSGPELIDRVARCGVPVWAVGGVTPEHAAEAFDAGAWGVAAISAIWDASDVNRGALALLAPWRDTEEK